LEGDSLIIKGDNTEADGIPSYVCSGGGRLMK